MCQRSTVWEACRQRPCLEKGVAGIEVRQHEGMNQKAQWCAEVKLISLSHKLPCLLPTLPRVPCLPFHAAKNNSMLLFERLLKLGRCVVGGEGKYAGR